MAFPAALALALVLGAAPPPAEADLVPAAPPSGVASRAPPTLSFTGSAFPPKGSPEDQELIRALLQAQAGVVAERAIAVQTTRRLATAGYDSRLASLEGSRSAQEAARTEGVRHRLSASWERVVEIMRSPWFVDPRLGCRGKGVELEVLMGANPTDPASSKLPLVRDKAKACLEAQILMLRPLERANQGLQAAISEANELLRAPGGGLRPKAGSGAPPAPASPLAGGE